MAEYIYGHPNKVNSWENVASIFAAHDSLNSAQTSSLPLVQFWCPSGVDFTGKRLNDDARKLLNQCLGENVTDIGAKLCFEYPVPVYPKSGRGKASMTDLMIVTKTHAIAVEAKWTELKDDYQAIDDWLAKDNMDNKCNIKKGWINYINEYLAETNPNIRKIDEEKISNEIVPYQLLHRIASACVVAKGEGMEDGKKGAAIIYQLFYNDFLNDDPKVKSVNDADVEAFKEKLQKGYEALFKDCESVPIKFFIVKTLVKKGLNFGNAMQSIKAQITPDWNELFIEMQKQGGIYEFASSELIFPEPKES